jgi:hypothetical protein
MGKGNQLNGGCGHFGNETGSTNCHPSSDQPMEEFFMSNLPSGSKESDGVHWIYRKAKSKPDHTQAERQFASELREKYRRIRGGGKQSQLGRRL